MAGNLLPLVLIGGIAVVLSKKKKKKRGKSGIVGNVVHVKSESQLPAIAGSLKPGQTLIAMVIDMQSPGHPAIKAEIDRLAAANPGILFAYSDYRWAPKNTGPGALTAVKKTGSGGTMGVGKAVFDGTPQSFAKEMAGLVPNAPSIAPGGFTPSTPSGPSGGGTPTRPDPTPAPSPEMDPDRMAVATVLFTRLAEITGNDDLNPGVRPLADVIMEFQIVMNAPRLDGVFDEATEDLLEEFIDSLSEEEDAGRIEIEALGYSELLAHSLPLAIGQFQVDWNWFVDYISAMNPDIDYEEPYTHTEDDGSWGPLTKARAAKALGKLSGIEPVYIEDIDRHVMNFNAMIRGLEEFASHSGPWMPEGNA